MDEIIWKKNIEEKEESVETKRRIFKYKSKSIGRFVLLLFFVFLSLFIWWYMHKKSAWVFTYSEYEGIVNLEKSVLDNSISSFFGLEMAKVNPNELEEKLMYDYIEISGVHAEKRFPNTIVFYVEEKNPQINYLNFTGIYIIDRDGEVLRANTTENSYEFSVEDYDLSRGMGSPNAEYVEDRIYASLSEEEMTDFDFETFDQAQKEKVLEEISSERKTKLVSILENRKNEFGKYVYSKYPVIYGWDEKEYSPGEFVDQEWLVFVRDAYDKFEEVSEYKIENALWDGDQRLIFSVNIDTEIVLFPNRDLEEQIEDFVLICDQIGGVNRIKSIDLSSHNVLVEYR